MSEAIRVVDCDVHEPFDQAGIARYTDPVWEGWHPIIPPLPYRAPAGDEGPATFESLREGVLEGAEFAVLTGTVHPGNAVSQFEYHAAFARAYNDWLVNEWLVRDERLYGSVQVTSQLPEVAAEEIDRWGGHPKMLQVVLPARGGEGFGLRKYRPIFEAAARHDFVVAFRPSASTRTAAGLPEYLAEWHAGVNQSFMGQILSLVFSGLFDEHPDLRVVCLGGGWTWVPYLMWTMDSNYRPLRAEVPWLKRLPSEHFPGHLYLSAHPIPEGVVPHFARVIEMAGGDDWLVWGSDYPSRGFGTPVALERAGLDQGLRKKILRDNGTRLYERRRARVAQSAPA